MMGDYAEDLLRSHMRGGIPYREPPGPDPRRPKTHPCPECKKLYRGETGVRMHLRDVHGIRLFPYGKPTTVVRD